MVARRPPRARRPCASASRTSTRRRGSGRATARAAPSSRGRSWPGRRSCRRSTRRSRPRARRAAPAPRARGAGRPRPRSGWCARSGSRRRPRSGAPPVARPAPRPARDRVSERSMPGVRPESIGPVCAVTAWRTSTRRVGFGDSVRRATSARRGVGSWHRREADRRRCTSTRRWYRRRTPVASSAVTDSPICVLARARPRPCSTPSPPTRCAALDGALAPTPSRTARRRLRRRRALAPLPRRRGPASVELARDDVEALRLLPGRLPPGPRPAAPVGLARLGLRALGARDQPRLPPRPRRAAPARRRDRRDRRRGPLRRVPPPARARLEPHRRRRDRASRHGAT